MQNRKERSARGSWWGWAGGRPGVEGQARVDSGWNQKQGAWREPLGEMGRFEWSTGAGVKVSQVVSVVESNFL